MFGMFRKLFLRTPTKGDLLSIETANCTEQEILALAKAWAEAKGLHWREPFSASYHYDESPYWLVESNALGKGGSYLQIDDTSKEVIGSKTYER